MPVFNERPEGNLKKMGGGIENYILSFLLKKILNIVKLKSEVQVYFIFICHLESLSVLVQRSSSKQRPNQVKVLSYSKYSIVKKDSFFFRTNQPNISLEAKESEACMPSFRGLFS